VVNTKIDFWKITLFSWQHTDDISKECAASIIRFTVTISSKGEGGTFEQGALLIKLNILLLFESVCHYFCISRVVPLLSS
jgi:hypothetical protein